MTFRDLVMTLVRRWYVLLVAVGLAAAAFFGFSSSGGVYSTEPIVAFAFPGARVVAPDNGVNNEDVIAFASTVAQAINNGRPIERYAADDAPLYGAGAREEVRIGVPNVGGQWGTSYTRAEIAISIVGRSEADVIAQQDELIAQVVRVADEEQATRGVPVEERITPSILPLSTRVEFIGSSGSQRLLAAGALGAAGLIVGCSLAVMLDRMLRRRAGRRSTAARQAREPRPGRAHPQVVTR